MSIRARITLVMALTAILVIVFGIGTGFIFTQGNMEKTIEKDMTAVAEIADALITTKINLLKSDAETVAVSLGGAADSKYHGILEGQLGKYADFMAFTVFSPGGVVATAGDPVTPPGLIDSEYIKRAFAGEMVISTTRFDPSGTLVFHVCVPAEKGYVLSATVSGMFFSEFVSDFTIWNTGNIFVIDETGTIIANVRDYMTLERYNFIELAKTDPVHESIGSFMENMIQEDRGIGRYTFGGVERICAYVTITGSNAGWSLGVAAPLPESPIRDVQSGFILVGFICFAISVMLAFFTSGPISKPYNELHEVMTALKDMDGLLRTTNDAATLLLGSGVGEFEKIMDQGMDMIAQSAGASRVRIWKNSGGGGNPSYESLYTWMDEKTSQQGLAHVPFAEKFPDWLARLQDKESINVSVTALPEEEQAAFTPHGILSLMLMPVFRQDQFWGFFSFEDCYDERPFSDDEESVLRSGCMLLANAMNRHETTLALIEAREEALSSAETKGNFLANMSHEMRTPLNAIIGLSELSLNLNEVQGETRINLEKVYNSGMTLLSLVNDILDISKIESGKFSLIPAEYDMPSVINDTITLNIMRKGSKLINFELNVDENLPSRLFGDELRLKQIFNNLLSNAFKYTKEGEVEWRISFEKDGDDIWLVSSVRDTGIGIRQNDIQKLFSDYNQVDVKSNRSVEGTGLGLSITQKLVEMMDGEITVTSEYGQGSVFTARVRQKVLDVTPIGSGVTENLKNFCYADHKRDRSSQIVRAYIPYANVLVVDDVATNLDVAKGMLRPYGMTVDCVAGGLEAIELIRSGTVQYNAVFMDHMMPGMDGIEALRVIRDEIGTEYAKTVPIIALTANALVGNERMFIEKGFQDFLSKPIDILRLNVVVNRWVRDKEKERIFAVNQNAAADHAERRRGEGRRKIQNRRSGIDRRKIFENAIDGFNFKSGLDRFGGSDEIYHDVLNSYIKNTPPLLDRISKPRPETLLDYAITVHGIKSSSFSIGAEPAGTKAEALEHAAKAGDFTYVVTNHAAFIETVKKLIADLTAMLKKTNPEEAKPLKPEPDKETLNALSQACAEYDIDGVDNAMEELERYEYESQPELIAWLKEQIGLMGFKQIHERLSGR